MRDKESGEREFFANLDIVAKASRAPGNKAPTVQFNQFGTGTNVQFTVPHEEGSSRPIVIEIRAPASIKKT